MKKERFPKLQTIILTAERHSRWGIGIVSFFIALIIHAIFLFGIKINFPPIGNWATGNVMTWVILPKKTLQKEKKNIFYLLINIKGEVANYINKNKFHILSSSKNVIEGKYIFPTNIIQKINYHPIRPAIFKLDILNNKKTFSLIQSSGDNNFDAYSAKFINQLPNNKSPKSKFINALITINLIKE